MTFTLFRPLNTKRQVQEFSILFWHLLTFVKVPQMASFQPSHKHQAEDLQSPRATRDKHRENRFIKAIHQNCQEFLSSNSNPGLALEIPYRQQGHLQATSKDSSIRVWYFSRHWKRKIESLIHESRKSHLFACFQRWLLFWFRESGKLFPTDSKLFLPVTRRDKLWKNCLHHTRY